MYRTLLPVAFGLMTWSLGLVAAAKKPPETWPLPLNGQPVSLVPKDKATATGDGGGMALLLTNRSAGTARYSLVVGSKLKDRGEIPGGLSGPLFSVLAPSKEHLTVTHTSGGTDLRVALYSELSDPDLELRPDQIPLKLVQYQTTGAKKLKPSILYSLEIKAQDESSAFVVFGLPKPVVVCVNEPSTTKIECDINCNDNTAEICLKRAPSLYIVNTSPTPSSEGWVSLIKLNQEKGLQVKRRPTVSGCFDWSDCE